MIMLDHNYAYKPLNDIIQDSIKSLNVSDDLLADAGTKMEKNVSSLEFKLKGLQNNSKKVTKPKKRLKNPLSTASIPKTTKRLIQLEKNMPKQKPKNIFPEEKTTAANSSDKENSRGLVEDVGVQGLNEPIDEVETDARTSKEFNSPVADSTPPSTKPHSAPWPSRISPELLLRLSRLAKKSIEIPKNPINFRCPNCGKFFSSLSQIENHVFKYHELRERIEEISEEYSFETIPDDYFLKKCPRLSKSREIMINCTTCALKFQKLQEYLQHVKKNHNKSIKNDKFSIKQNSESDESFRESPESSPEKLITINHNSLLKQFQLEIKQSEISDEIYEDYEFLEMDILEEIPVKLSPGIIETKGNVDKPKKSILKLLSKPGESKKVTKNCRNRVKIPKIIEILTTIDQSTESYRLNLIKSHRSLFNLKNTLKLKKIIDCPSIFENSKKREFRNLNDHEEINCDKNPQILDVNDNNLDISFDDDHGDEENDSKMTNFEFFENFYEKKMNIEVINDLKTSSDDLHEEEKNLNVLRTQNDLGSHSEESSSHNQEEKDLNDSNKSSDNPEDREDLISEVISHLDRSLNNYLHDDDEDSIEDCPFCLKGYRSEKILHHLMTDHIRNEEYFGKIEDIEYEEEAAVMFSNTCEKEYLSSIYDYWGYKVQNEVPEAIYCLKCNEDFDGFYDYKIHNAKSHDLFCVMCHVKFDDVSEALGHKEGVHKSVEAYVWFVDSVLKSLAGIEASEGVERGRDCGEGVKQL